LKSLNFWKWWEHWCGGAHVHQILSRPWRGLLKKGLPHFSSPITSRDCGYWPSFDRAHHKVDPAFFWSAQQSTDKLAPGSPSCPTHFSFSFYILMMHAVYLQTFPTKIVLSQREEDKLHRCLASYFYNTACIMHARTTLNLHLIYFAWNWNLYFFLI
jgi:hypothetical protein